MNVIRSQNHSYTQIVILPAHIYTIACPAIPSKNTPMLTHALTLTRIQRIRYTRIQLHTPTSSFHIHTNTTSYTQIKQYTQHSVNVLYKKRVYRTR